MNEKNSKNKKIKYTGVFLAVLVSLIHLFHPTHGFTKLLLIVSTDFELILSDPRPFLFFISSFSIIIGMNLIVLGFPKKPIYIIGIILMIVYIVGYFGWHLSGHGGFLPGREPLYHGLSPHQAVIDHITTDLSAAVAIISEVILGAILVFLYKKNI